MRIKGLGIMTLYLDEEYRPFYMDLCADVGQLQVKDNEEEREEEEES